MTTAAENHPDQVRELVAANLRKHLKDNRWSQRKAAEALHLTPAYVNRRAAGETDLSASDLAMFARFLNVPVQNFFMQITDWSLAPVTRLIPRSGPTRHTDGQVTNLHAHR